MEENKKCCESGACEKCTDKKEGACCGHMCHGKCPMLKILVPILIIVAAFYAGTLVGGRGNFRDYGERGRFMMDNNYGPRNGLNNLDITVQPNSNNPTTSTPEVKQ